MTTSGVSTLSSYRFQIALSFAGSHHETAHKIATILRDRIGPDSVFFADWFQPEILGGRMDIVLNRIYREQTLMVIHDVSEDYLHRSWCRAEADAIRALRFELDFRDPIDRGRLLPVRFDKGDVPEMPTDGTLDAWRCTAEEVAEQIWTRYRLVRDRMAEREMQDADTTPPEFPRECVEKYFRDLMAGLAETVWRRPKVNRPVRMEDVMVPVRIRMQNRVLSSKIDDCAGSREHAAAQGDVFTSSTSSVRSNSWAECSRADASISTLYEEPIQGTERYWDDIMPLVHRAVVLGGPGGGKTFLARHITHCLAGAGLDRLQNPALDPSQVDFPILITAEELARGGGAAAHDLVLDLLEQKFHISFELRSWVRARLQTMNCWLMIDALDEVTEQNRPRLTKALAELGKLGTRLICTCRIATFRADQYSQSRLIPWSTLETFELAPFETAMLLQLVRQWFRDTPALATSLVAAFNRNYPLSNACRNPMIATLACLAHEETAITETTRRSDLYGKFLHAVAQKAWKTEQISLDQQMALDTLLHSLEAPALRLFKQDPGSNIFSYLKLKQAFAGSGTDGIHQDLLTCDVFVPSGRSADGQLQFSFVHRTFLEYLAACALADEGWDSIRGFVQKVAGTAEWQEVLILLAGKLLDPLPLVDMLLDQHLDDLLRRNLGLAALCLSEIREPDRQTVDRVATELAHAWWEHELKETAQSIPHLERALEAMVHYHPKIESLPISDWLSARVPEALGKNQLRLRVLTMQGRLNLVRNAGGPVLDLETLLADEAVRADDLADCIRQLPLVDPVRKQAPRLLAERMLQPDGEKAAAVLFGLADELHEYPELFSNLQTGLNCKNPAIRHYSLFCLGKLANRTETRVAIIDILLEALPSEWRGSLRPNYWRVLADMHPSCWENESNLLKCLEAFFEEYRQNPQTLLQAVTWIWLTNAARSIARSTKAFERLERALHDENDMLRFAAAIILAWDHVEDESARNPAIHQALLDNISCAKPPIRFVCVMALHGALTSPNCTNRSAISEYTAFCRSAASSDPCSMIRLLARNPRTQYRELLAADPEAVNLLLASSKSPDWVVRVFTAYGFSQLPSALQFANVQAVIAALLLDPTRFARIQALSAVESAELSGWPISSELGLSILVPPILSDDLNIPEDAIRSLARSAGPFEELSQVLCNLLRHPNQGVRARSAVSMAQFLAFRGSAHVLPGALKSILDLNQSPDLNDRQAAANALNILNSYGFRFMRSAEAGWRVAPPQSTEFEAVSDAPEGDEILLEISRHWTSGSGSHREKLEELLNPVRTLIGEEFGFSVPPISLRISEEVGKRQYCLNYRGERLAEGWKKRRWLIPQDAKAQHERDSLMQRTVDVIRERLYLFINWQTTAELLDTTRLKRGKNLAGRLVPELLSISELSGLLKGLLKAGLKQIDLEHILLAVERVSCDSKGRASVDGLLKELSTDLSLLVPPDSLRMEIGFGLLPVCDPDVGGPLLPDIRSYRPLFAEKVGFVLPSVRVMDNSHLQPNDFTLSIGREVVRTGTIANTDIIVTPRDSRFAHQLSQDAVPAETPSGIKGWRVTRSNRTRYPSEQFEVFDPASSALIQVLAEASTEHAPTLLGFNEVETIFRRFLETRADQPEIPADYETARRIHRILRALLQQHVSIRDFDLIFDTFWMGLRNRLDGDAMISKIREAVEKASPCAQSFAARTYKEKSSD